MASNEPLRRVVPVEPVPEFDYRMRARQLASTVRQGIKVTFTILDENPVYGYLAGWDDDTYFVVHDFGGEMQKTLIPKQNILRIDIASERTFREEALYEEMNKIVARWRDYINKNYFRGE